jgi:hypothetical protein
MGLIQQTDIATLAVVAVVAFAVGVVLLYLAGQRK